MDAKPFSRGAEMSHKTVASIPADAVIRPLHDHIVVEPIDGVMSSIIAVVHECKPMRGIVRAVGPGKHHWKYNHPDKHRRTSMKRAKHFTPCAVKVGDVVEFGGLERGGVPFQTFYHGDKLMLMASERDVCGVVEGA